MCVSWKFNWKSIVSDSVLRKHSYYGNVFADAPKVDQLATELYTGLDLEEEIVCTVHSSPRAEVTWTKDGQTLENSSPELVFSQEANKHSLTLTKINKDAFGKYTCEAKNEYGMDRSSVEVSGKVSIKMVRP